MTAPHAPSPVPKRWRQVRLRDLGWLPGYAFRAAYFLLRARKRFGALEVADLRDRNIALEQATRPPSQRDPQMVERVAFVMPRIATVMPFRSDCLIQSTGAQSWLARYGIPSRIVIGVERPEDGPFAAHAWLEHGGMIVTGGDVSQYTVLL